jgi:2-polyprenyl-3-methyl-5-hydroxy-6-metoxy-1,4-benzoquinol methylase
MKEKFEFIENDTSGAKTLDAISEADRFNKWMYETIKPFCKGNILEIGSGIGNISTYFIEDDLSIQLTDIRKGYCEKLKQKFAGKPNLLGVVSMNLVDDNFDNKFADHFNTYETVFALNVVEHIKDDDLALQNCYKLLKSGGCLIILVPSYQLLYNQFDIELGHYRRYNKKKLSNLFYKNNYDIIHKQYFNCAGIFGWYFTGKILKRKTIPKGQMSIYNSLVPVFKILDKIIFNSIGLSTICVGKKT